MRRKSGSSCGFANSGSMVMACECSKKGMPKILIYISKFRIPQRSTLHVMRDAVSYVEVLDVGSIVDSRRIFNRGNAVRSH